jgi:hypothetical protein
MGKQGFQASPFFNLKVPSKWSMLQRLKLLLVMGVPTKTRAFGFHSIVQQ